MRPLTRRSKEAADEVLPRSGPRDLWIASGRSRPLLGVPGWDCTMRSVARQRTAWCSTDVHAGFETPRDGVVSGSLLQPLPAPFPAIGLTAAEARQRLQRDGPNLLPRPQPVPAWRRLVAQMVHFFALMLWIAGALAFVAGMPQLAVAIFVVDRGERRLRLPPGVPGRAHGRTAPRPPPSPSKGPPRWRDRGGRRRLSWS